eukprot:15456377-Alexandrium_andersonii.AAC.1
MATALSGAPPKLPKTPSRRVRSLSITFGRFRTLSCAFGQVRASPEPARKRTKVTENVRK